ncbi:MAG: hypothetical protein QME46_08450 [Thermoanaerobacteraceae bacterium]|nr:hypothetical protein [Thermoanaerobacteraceae bacterium]
MKDKGRDQKLNSNYHGENKSMINEVNKTFTCAVDVVASIELFEEYVYIKYNLYRLENSYMEDELTNKFSYIDDIIIDFKQVLNMEGVLKSKKIFELYQIKKLLMRYYEEYRFLSSYAHHIYRLYNYWCNKNDRYRRKYDLKDFYKKLYASLRDRDEQTVKNIQQEIMSVIPIRVTKEFFFNYLKNSISGKIEEDPDGALEMIYDIYEIITENFDESNTFPDNPYFRYLKEYINMDYKGMSRRKLRIYCSELNRYSVILDMICDVIWSYIMSANRIMMILLDFDINYKSLIELEPLVAIAYRYVLNPDNGREMHVNSKALFHQLRMAIHRWYDVLKRCSVTIEDINNLNLEDGDMVTEDLVDFVNYFYYLNILASENEDMEFDGYNEISSEDLYMALDSIIYEIDFKLGILKPDERKIMIRDVISSVYPVFKNVNEFISFVKKSVEFDTTDAEKALTIKSINDILKRYKLLD